VYVMNEPAPIRPAMEPTIATAAAILLSINSLDQGKQKVLFSFFAQSVLQLES